MSDIGGFMGFLQEFDGFFYETEEEDYGEDWFFIHRLHRWTQMIG